MKQIVRIAFLSFLSFSLGACGLGLLHSNEEKFPASTPYGPGAIPDPPRGDETKLTGPAFRVVKFSPDPNNKEHAIRLQNKLPAPQQQITTFLPSPNRLTEKVEIKWAGTDRLRAIKFTVTSRNGATVYLNGEAGRGTIKANGQTKQTNWSRLDHIVFIELNPKTDTFKIFATLQSGEGKVELTGPLSANFTGAKDLALNVTVDRTTDTSVYYLLRNLVISSDTP